MGKRVTTYAVAALLLLTSLAEAASIPALRCQAGKNHEAGRYAMCRQDAEKKLVLTGDPTKYSDAVARCETKFAKKWQQLTDAATTAGSACPDGPLTTDAYKAVIDEHTANIATALRGGGLEVYPGAARLKTGQTACYDGSGSAIDCAGTGQDGELQKGVTRHYVDNGDGTIADISTGLMWEKKSDDNSIHGIDYGPAPGIEGRTWADAFSVFIAGLNSGGGFAGYTDWRLPNVNELQSLVTYGEFLNNPTVDPAFNTNCTPGCTVTTCSCTQSGYYWSSTTRDRVGSTDYAWIVNFDGNDVVRPYPKGQLTNVRAVRGGL